jgi:dihydrofolate reductase
MTRKVVVLEAVSLDGVFEAETMGQWAQPHYSDEREEVIRDLVLSSGSLLMGRATYDLQVWYWPNQPNDKYGITHHKNNITKYVVTSTPLQTQWNNTTIIGGNVVDEIGKLKQQPGKDVLIEGSAMLVAALAQAGLIDEYHLLVHPVIVGSGKHFFREGIGMMKLKLVESKPIRLGIVLLTYEPAR